MWYHRAFSERVAAGMNVSGSANRGLGALACHPEPGRAVCKRRWGICCSFGLRL